MTEDDRRFSALRTALLLGVFLCISFPGIIFGSHTFVYRDDGLFGYPVAYFFRQCVWQGHLPLWNPYSNCGIPFLAQWNTLVLYPFSILYLFAPMPWAMNYFLIGHMVLAGVGMYFLAWRWFGNGLAASVAAVAFAWNGLSINLFLWPCHIAALGWMPFVVLAVDLAATRGGRLVSLAILAGGCQMMTGSPEIIFFTWIIALAVCFTLRRDRGFGAIRMGFRLGFLVLAVSVLSAVQLLPLFDFVAHGYRSAAFDRGYWALPPWGVANFFVPLFRDSPSMQGVYWQPGQEMFSSYYAGIVTMALALLAVFKARDRRAVLLLVLALAGLDCALGDAGYGLPLLKKLLPFLGFARYPVKFVVIPIFCLPLLAAAGVHWLQSRPAGRRGALLLTFGLTAAVIAAVLLVSRLFPFPNESWSVTWQSGWSRLVILLTALAILWLCHPVRPLLGFGLLLLMGVDICTHMPVEMPTVAVAAYDPAVPPMLSLPKLGQSRAFVRPAVDLWTEHLANSSGLALYMGHRSELFKNCNLLNSIPKADGFFSLYLREQDQVANLFAHNYPTNLAEFLGVSQLASDKQFFVWDAQTNFMPMATIGQQPIFLDDAATLKAIGAPEFKPREFVYLPSDLKQPPAALHDPQAKILRSHTEIQSCQYDVEAAQPTMLVMAQTWCHCWKAQIDGHPTDLFRANYDFQAVAVPAGRHQIHLFYQDTLFRSGAVVSLLSLALCLRGGLRRV